MRVMSKDKKSDIFLKCALTWHWEWWWLGTKKVLIFLFVSLFSLIVSDFSSSAFPHVYQSTILVSWTLHNREEVHCQGWFCQSYPDLQGQMVSPWRKLIQNEEVRMCSWWSISKVKLNHQTRAGSHWSLATDKQQSQPCNCMRTQQVTRLWCMCHDETRLWSKTGFLVFLSEYIETELHIF